ncbi:MAG TPA: DUF4157 domain-containing protein [Acidimicrobiales bacterium]|nr:DUF4157 domain-containing protein [Acidimicrobiales bacterium]
MSEFDLIHDLNLAPKAKAGKERAGDDHDHTATAVSLAVTHSRPDALGPRGAMHVQRAAGNAAMGALVQRQAEEESPVHKVVGKGGGSALDTGVRSQMESTMGYDFGGVRVHTGSDAAGAAKSVQAQAFTVGNDIVFNEGKYNPSSPEGQRTIAHELTHVVQQSQGEVPGQSNGAGLKVSDPGDWAERQAEATADAVMSSGPAGGDHAGHDHGGSGGGGASVQTLPLQRAEGAEEMEAQTLRDPSLQRAEAAPGELEEEEVQTLREPTLQRAEAPGAEEETEEVQALREPTAQREEAPEEEEMPA